MQYLGGLKFFLGADVLLKSVIRSSRVSQEFCFHFWVFLMNKTIVRFGLNCAFLYVTPSTLREVCACQLVYMRSSRQEPSAGTGLSGGQWLESTLLLELVDQSWQWGMRGTEPPLTLDAGKGAEATAPHAWRPERRN